MKNDRSKELKIWRSIIQPIIDVYEIRAIAYRYIPKEYDEADIIKIERLTNQLCNQRPFNSFRELMLKWQNGITNGTFQYKKFFIEFINHLFNEGSLSHFLEFLYRENEKNIEKSTETRLLPCEPGTKWEEIKITLIDKNAVRIETPQGKNRFSYHDLEMADKRTSDRRPTALWELLKLFARSQGYIYRTNVNYDPKLPDTAKRLNRHLQNLFNIHESIFKAHYKAERGYRTKIMFSDQTQVT